MINIPKGTKDVLPLDSYKWQYVEGLAREVCRLFNVKEIRSPVFEHTELFLRSIGDETDVVSKEMYTFLDKGNRSITLKPEGTASVARSFVENNLEQQGLPLKMYYITPVFRYERPQAGRLREHHQFGVEFYGGAGAEYDFEVISLAYTLLTKLGIGQLTLSLNSIGCNSCRGKYNMALKGFLKSKLTDLCPTCQTRYEKNPLRILDCKVENCKKIIENAPKILDYVCEDCLNHMNILTALLTRAQIPFEINPNIVRGLDYYTKTVFEFVTTALGSQGTVCGGGRYDNLVQSVGGKDTPCVGFGMGLERIIMLMEALNVPIKDTCSPDVFVMSQAAQYADFAFKLTNDLRMAGISAECDNTGRSLKAQFKFADKLQVKYAIVIGESEMENGEVSVKEMLTSTTQTIAINKLPEFLRR